MIIKIEITLPKNNRELRKQIDKELNDINYILGRGWDDTNTSLKIDTSFEDE